MTDVAGTTPSRSTRAIQAARSMLLKELLVASRNGRSYLLRVAYLATMAIYVVSVYISLFPDGTTTSYNQYQMGQLGKTVIAHIAGFQLVGVTAIAILLMSTAISDEINRRTLVPLLTTPLSDLQLVVGKLAGRMAQMLLTVLMALPLLGVVRVFGGVDYRYILACTSVTLCWGVLVAAVTMRVSLHCRGPFMTAIISAGIVTGYSLVSALGSFACCCALGSSSALINPFTAFGMLTMDLMQPGSQPMPWMWPLPCVGMLGMSLLVIYLTAKRLRPMSTARLFGGEGHEVPLFDAESKQRLLTALRQAGMEPPRAAGPPPVADPLRWRTPAQTMAPPPLPPAALASLPASVPAAPMRPAPPMRHRHEPEPFSAEVFAPNYVQPTIGTAPRTGRIRSVHGSPILWKELRRQMISRLPKVLVILVGVIIAITYMTLIASGTITSRVTQGIMIDVLLGLDLLTLLLALSDTLAGERESRSLTALLTTPMSDWRILADKSAGAFLVAWPMWLLLLAHIAVFFILGIIHPLSLVLVLLALCSVIGLHLGAGLLLGSRLKRPAGVLAGNFMLGAVLWAGLPLTVTVLRVVLPWNGWNVILSTNPFVQIYVALTGAGWTQTPMVDFHWPGGIFSSIGASTLAVVVPFLVYTSAATFMTCLAKRNLRREA